ncbi:hypothetical protein LCGC14_0469460 [marine sediment metagenome]|uniref:Uncharacterized protein n=1 Tax=marine sediment metagenome TaxID=412755 RepID=A0A0F9UZA5_9ZZZZ
MKLNVKDMLYAYANASIDNDKKFTWPEEE